jgi:hypothetical protein
MTSYETILLIYTESCYSFLLKAAYKRLGLVLIFSATALQALPPLMHLLNGQ